MNLLHPRVGVRVVCRKRGQYTAQAPIEIDLPANADTLACNKYLLFVFFLFFFNTEIHLDQRRREKDFA